MYQFVNILSYVSVFSVLIPIMLYFGKKIQSISSFFFALLLASFLSDICHEIYTRAGYKGYYVLNAFIFVQFLLISCIYYFLLKNKKLVYVNTIIFILFSIFNVIFIQPIQVFQGWPLSVESILILMYSINYYNQALKINPPIDLLRHYPFWINTAIFFYFSFDLFLFAMSNYILEVLPNDIKMTVWGFHNLNNIIKNILFAVSITYVGVKQENFGKAMRTA